MAVNQIIKKELKHGDISKIAHILGVDPSSVSERLNSKKDVDSVSFINAVCEVTKKPFSYFQPDIVISYSEEGEDKMIVAELKQHYNIKAAELAHEDAIRHWRDKYNSLKKVLDMNDNYIKQLEVEKAELIKKLKGGA